MALKTFNIDEVIYKKFFRRCKGYGLSMSKQVEMFMASQIEEEPRVRAEYIRKLDKIRKGKFIRIGSIGDFVKRYKV